MQHCSLSFFFYLLCTCLCHSFSLSVCLSLSLSLSILLVFTFSLFVIHSFFLSHLMCIRMRVCIRNVYVCMYMKCMKFFLAFSFLYFASPSLLLVVFRHFPFFFSLSFSLSYTHALSHSCSRTRSLFSASFLTVKIRNFPLCCFEVNRWFVLLVGL